MEHTVFDKILSTFEGYSLLVDVILVVKHVLEVDTLLEHADTLGPVAADDLVAHGRRNNEFLQDAGWIPGRTLQEVVWDKKLSPTQILVGEVVDDVPFTLQHVFEIVDLFPLLVLVRLESLVAVVDIHRGDVRVVQTPLLAKVLLYCGYGCVRRSFLQNAPLFAREEPGRRYTILEDDRVWNAELHCLRVFGLTPEKVVESGLDSIGVL